MKQKALWINQIKGLSICLVVIYHSVITFYPHLDVFQHPWSEILAKCWIYFNLYLAPFRMPVFFFISGLLIRRYIDDVPWRGCVDKRIWSIVWVLALWGLIQWGGLTLVNQWLAPERDLSNASNAAYAGSFGGFLHGMVTASTSLWYLYAMILYFPFCKMFSRWKAPLLVVLALLSVAINFLPTPWWGMNSVLRNVIFYALGSWYGAVLLDQMKTLHFRRYALPLAVLICLSVPLYFLNVPLLISLLSIFMIMKLFYTFSNIIAPKEKGLLNVVGTNTIAIYTTHRILIEAFSLALLAQLNQGLLSRPVELAILLVYPFASLAICTLFGLATRRLSAFIFSDVLFTPPRPLVAAPATR